MTVETARILLVILLIIVGLLLLCKAFVKVFNIGVDFGVALGLASSREFDLADGDINKIDTEKIMNVGVDLMLRKNRIKQAFDKDGKR